MTIKEMRPVVCYRCGQLLGQLETEWTQEGMARFREQAEALRRDHACPAHDTRKEPVSVGRR